MIRSRWNNLKALLRVLFIDQERSPTWLSVSMVVIEAAVVMVIVQPELLASSKEVGSSIYGVLGSTSTVQTAVIGLMLLVCLLVRVTLKTSLIRSMYGVILAVSLQLSLLAFILLLLLLAVLITADILSTCDNSFYFGNAFSEWHNWTKVAHYCGTISVILIYSLQLNSQIGWYCGFIYLVLLAMRMLCIMTNRTMKCLLEVCYMSLAFQIILKETINGIVNELLMLLIVLCVSAAIVNVKDRVQLWLHRKTIRLEGNQAYYLGFDMLVYIFRGCYQTKQQLFAEDFFRINKLVVEPESDCTDVNIETKEGHLHSLYIYLRRTAKPDDWDELFVRGQVELFIGKNMIATAATVRLLEELLQGFQPFRRLLLNRLKGCLEEIVNIRFEGKPLHTFEECCAADHLIEVLWKSAELHRDLWKSSGQSEVSLKKVEKSIEGVIAIRGEVDHCYKSLKLKQRVCITHYLCYSYFVQHNVRRTQQLSKEPQLQYYTLNNINWDYVSLQVKIDITGNQLAQIISVSNNVSGHLGYTPDELIGENLDVLVPSFYRQQHRRQVTKRLGKEITDLDIYNFRKQTICETKSRGYMEVEINLRIHIVEGEIAYYGFVRPLKKRVTPVWWEVREANTNIILLRAPRQEQFDASSQFAKTGLDMCRSGLDMSSVAEVTPRSAYRTSRYKDRSFTDMMKPHAELSSPPNEQLYTHYATVHIDDSEDLAIYYSQQNFTTDSIEDKNYARKLNQFSKFAMANDTSLAFFFQMKDKLLAEDYSFKRELSILLTAILVLLLAAAIVTCSLYNNTTEAAAKFVTLDTALKLQQRELYTSTIMASMHYAGLIANSPQLSKSGMTRAIQALNMEKEGRKIYGTGVTATETMPISGKQSRMASFILVEAFHAIIGELMLQPLDGSWQKYIGNSQIHYLLVNEEELTRRVLFGQRSYYLSYLTRVNRSNSIFWYLFQTSLPVLLLACTVLLIVNDRKNTRRRYTLVLSIYQVSNGYRKELLRSISCFKELVTGANPTNIANLTVSEHSNGMSFRQRDSLSRGPESLASPNSASMSMTPKYDEQSTLRMIRYKDSIKSYEVKVPDSDNSPRSTNQKLQRFNLPLLIFCLLVVGGGVALCALTLLNAFQSDYSSTAYVNDGFILHGQCTSSLLFLVITYFQQTEFYFKGISNASSCQVFKDIGSGGQSFPDMKYLDRMEFTDFRHQFGSFANERLCNVVDCSNSCASGWQNITMEAEMSLNSNDMAVQIDGLLKGTVQPSDAKASTAFTDARCGQQLFPQFIDALYQHFYSGATKTIDSIRKSLNNYILGEYALLAAMLVFLVLPFTVTSILQRRNATEILSLLELEQFTVQHP